MVFAQAVKAQKPRLQSAKITAWIYAGVLTVMALAQLFAFEKLVPLFQGMAFPGGEGTGSLLICLIVFYEVFSVPFLLRMPLSPLMRWVSMVFSLLGPLMWLGVALWTMNDSTVTNAGILGTKVAISPGLQVVAALVLLVFAALSARGLWPSLKK